MKKSKQAHREAARAAQRASISATEAQNNFGRVLDRAASEGVVFITKHRRPQAVLLSVDRYEALTQMERPDLDELTREFDQMMERMQSSRAAAGYDTLFSASEETLGEAAAREARRAADASPVGADPTMSSRVSAKPEPRRKRA